MDSFVSTSGKGVPELRALIAKDTTEGQSTNGAWNDAWINEVTPWDTNDGCQPPLIDLFTSGRCGIDWKALSENGKAKSIVPGCGRGYDASFFATQGFESIGVDLSPIAVEIAIKYLAASKNPPSNVNFKSLDFFNSPLLKAGDYSLAFDYTFLVAIPPAFRLTWAARFSELIRTGGYLICLMFPLDGNRQGGPPYSLDPSDYSELLGETFELVWIEAPSAKTSAAGHEGKEKISVWKRK